jgi:hypothetical protein
VVGIILLAPQKKQAGLYCFGQQFHLASHILLGMKVKDPSLAVECPVCSALSERRCEYALGGPRIESHWQRRELAIKQAEGDFQPIKVKVLAR